MSAKGFLLLGVILSAVSPLLAPLPEVQGTFGSLSKLTSGLVKGTVNKYVFDKMDAEGIKDKYKPTLNRLQSMKWSCVIGLMVDDEKTEENLQLIGGQLSNQVQVTMEVPDTSDSDGDTVTGVVKFEFPALSLKYGFTYNGKQAFIKFKRDGTVTLTQAPIVVEVTVQVPRSRTKINSLENAKLCFATVKNIQTKANNAITNVEVQYKSMTGLGFTGGYVKVMVENLKRDIRKNIKDTLQLHVETVLRQNSATCPDPTVQLKPINPKKDCEDVRTATEYKLL